MNNNALYDAAFLQLFQLDNVELLTGLEYQGVPMWDSVGHMELIARLESDFNVMIDMDDVIDFSSYLKGKEILLKYKVLFE
jgi:hypothetical protein